MSWEARPCRERSGSRDHVSLLLFHCASVSLVKIVQTQKGPSHSSNLERGRHEKTVLAIGMEPEPFTHGGSMCTYCVPHTHTRVRVYERL